MPVTGFARDGPSRTWSGRGWGPQPSGSSCWGALDGMGLLYRSRIAVMERRASGSESVCIARARAGEVTFAGGVPGRVGERLDEAPVLGSLTRGASALDDIPRLSQRRGGLPANRVAIGRPFDRVGWRRGEQFAQQFDVVVAVRGAVGADDGERRSRAAAFAGEHPHRR